jgi:hypothetical protein
VLSVVLIICAVNLMSVKVFGELEFWFSFFKVATIIIMIVAGFGIIWGLATAGSRPVSITCGATAASSATAGWDGDVAADGDVRLRRLKLSVSPPVKRKTRRNPFRAPSTRCRCVFWCSMWARCSSLCLSTRGTRWVPTVARSS